MSEEARPFLKWAGGKKQLLPAIEEYLPARLKEGKIDIYFEPFVGAGAVYFYVAHNYKIKNAYLFDINEELVLTYQVVKNSVEQLIAMLEKMQTEFLDLNQDGRKSYYYQLREMYNQNKKSIDFGSFHPSWIARAAHTIFLNRTCFNGLYRVNRAGHFNVPMGSYKNPSIYSEQNLEAVSSVLKNAVIRKADFESIRPHVNSNSFIYYDPPYRPLSETSYFTSYSTNGFNDDEQRRLAGFFKEMHKKGAKQLLSNSDPKNINPGDDFFDSLYADFNTHRVQATRMINASGKGRGPINELLISNYEKLNT